MLKVEPSQDYPPEEGHYLRGNDYSPVAVAVILIYDYDKIPKEIEQMVRDGVETGAALSGTIQTENIGIEKMVCNIIGNPNIRYIVLTGPESPGHSTGEAIMALVKNGIDKRKRIIGCGSPTPYLFNLHAAYVERFRNQSKEVVNLLNRGTFSCYQEAPTQFEDYTLYDIGAYPEGSVSAKLTWRVTNPVAELKDEEERRQKEELQKMMEMIKRKVEENKRQKVDHE